MIGERLADKLKTTSALKWFPGRGVEENWIAELEEEVGFGLPPSCRWWLVYYGNARLNGGNILSIASPENMTTQIFFIYIG
ncbi:hypothetical protein J6TS1_37800 [Siminovitchia terrae]|uniref:SMI1/KNR4 family protein n=1 Tax=Siminovitchia terrae TaxID=1914933 RepID=A0ABQ4L118_SIMTE|nr:hypothetical protein J6TS1_37800 [Siminovitchia terrae]